MLRLIIISLFLLTQHTFATSSLTSAQIINNTLKALPHCLHYRVRGVCIWFSPGSGFNKTVYVDHYSPDLVVSVFNKVGDNPWAEINATLDRSATQAQQQLIKSVTNDQVGGGDDQSVLFKEADVIGNPALSVLPRAILLPSTALPLRPYFQSMLDSLLWRGFTPVARAEELSSVVTNAIYHVGTFPMDWGGVFPHQGFMLGNDDAVVSSVIALRAAHLLTLPPALKFGHVAATLATRCGQACQATPITVNDPNTQLQRIYPQPENSCHVLGRNLNDLVAVESEKQNYIYVIWRRYQGCIDGEGKLVAKIVF